MKIFRRNIALIALVSTTISACATSQDAEFQRTEDASDVQDALATPVGDLNIAQQEIPEYLALMDDPYNPVPENCTLLLEQLDKLNDLLGADLDVPVSDEELRNQRALNATSATAGGFIPFRGIVRALSGASEHDRKVRDAYERGLIRRAFLKGISGEIGCKT